VAVRLIRCGGAPGFATRLHTSSWPRGCRGSTGGRSGAELRSPLPPRGYGRAVQALTGAGPRVAHPTTERERLEGSRHHGNPDDSSGLPGREVSRRAVEPPSRQAAEPRATGHVPRAMSHEPRATGHGPRATTDTRKPRLAQMPAGLQVTYQTTVAEAEGLEPPSGCPRRISSAMPYQLGLRLLYPLSRDGRI
jgi:hypothetical protein